MFLLNGVTLKMNLSTNVNTIANNQIATNDKFTNPTKPYISPNYEIRPLQGNP